MRIATSRYWNTGAIEASGLAPVGTTVGPPRFPLKYELAASVGMLTPYGLRQIESRSEFEPLYRARLAGFGVDRIARLLEAIATAADAPGVVLLCFEDLTKQGLWCHRSIFASWWQENTGQEVCEL